MRTSVSFVAGLLVAGLWACNEPRAAPAPGVPRSEKDAGALDGSAGDARVPADAGQTDAQAWPAADYEISLPYGGGTRTLELVVTAELRRADVHLNIDTTASIAEEVDALQSELRRSILPRLRARIDDVSFGVSRFADFPAAPFGRGGRHADTAFELLTPITSNAAAVARAVAALDQPLGAGGDFPEAGAEALFQVATGVGYAHEGTTYIEPWPREPSVGGGTLGGVGFRANALHVVLHVTDASTHSPDDYDPHFPGTRSMTQAAEALRNVDARAIGLLSTTCEGSACRVNPIAYAQLAKLSLETLATFEPTRQGCPSGLGQVNDVGDAGVCPMAYAIDGSGRDFADQVIDSVITLLDTLSFRAASASVHDDALGLVMSIEPFAVAQPAGVTPPTLGDLTPDDESDARPDTFLDVRQGASLGFRVALRNDRIAEVEIEQRFRLAIDVLGDGTLIAQPVIRVRVPAREPSTGAYDAGARDANDDDAGF
jgi:hypothetical protein